MRNLFKRGGVGRRGGIVFLAVVVGSIPAFAGLGGAAVTTPTAGQIVRDVGAVNVHEGVGGQYTGGSNLSNSTAAVICTGTKQASGTIKVIRQSDLVEVVNLTHPTPNVGPLPLSPSAATRANALGPYDATWDTTTATPGIYRILSTAKNVTGAACTATNVTLSDFTVEYRPWQHTFRDILNTGSVSMNTVGAREFSYKVKDKSSDAVIDGTTAMKLFELGDPASFTFPSDPTTCTTNPLSCLPPTAKQCANTGPCNARLVVVNYQPNVAPPNKLIGIFDLQTKAFVASASAKGTTRILASLGTQLDPQLVALLGGAITGAESATGADVANLLATKVRLRMAGPQGQETSVFVSLSELVTIVQGMKTGPNGINVLAPFSVNAGYMIHSYAFTLPAGSPAQPEGFYDVEESQLVPSVPLPIPVPGVPEPIPPLLLEPGGTLKHITGRYPEGTGAHSVGSKACPDPNDVLALIGGCNLLGSNALDTAPDEPNGLPAWLPLISKGKYVPDSQIDFVGHAIVLEADTDLSILGRLQFGLIIGFGASIFGDNPLPIGFGDLPLIWDEQSPAVQDLIAAIDEQVGGALANPTVAEALTTVLGLL